MGNALTLNGGGALTGLVAMFAPTYLSLPLLA
jgi:hypothetical protein